MLARCSVEGSIDAGLRIRMSSRYDRYAVTNLVTAGLVF